MDDDLEVKPDSFAVMIELGNAAMQTPHDVAAVLRKLADTIEDLDEAWSTSGGSLRDLNGNTVLRWSLAP